MAEDVRIENDLEDSVLTIPPSLLARADEVGRKYRKTDNQ